VSSTQIDRNAILKDLNEAMRRSGAQGSLFSQAVASRLGISASDFECLDLIVLEGAATPGRLAEVTGLTTGAITGVIDRLERAGWVRREPDPTDRRRVLVKHVPERSGEIYPYYESLVAQMNALFAHLDDGDLARLLDLFHRFNDVVAREITALKNRGRD